MPPGDEGLRAQKKAETRATISLAAIRLVADRGMAGVTGEDIAAAARVAPRTFRNYFPNKEAAILYSVDLFVGRLVELVATRDRTEPLLRCLEAATVALVETPDAVYGMLTVRALSRENHQLRVRWAAANSNLNLSGLTEQIADRTATNPDRDVYPRVVAHCTWGVIVAAMDTQRRPHFDDADLIDRLRLGFNTLRGGLALPT
jgi:AcrR family transcriptional regulator